MKIENKKRERVSEIVAHKIWSFRGFHAMTGMLYGILLTLSSLNICPKQDRENITGFWDKVVTATRIAFGREKTEANLFVETLDVEKENVDEEIIPVYYEEKEVIIPEGPDDGLLGSGDFPEDVFEDNPISNNSRSEESKKRLKELFENGTLKKVLSSQQLANLIYVESTGRNGLVGDKQLGDDPDLWAYGVLQVRKCYVDDVNKLCGTEVYAIDCKNDPELSILVTQAYMNRYAKKRFLGREPSFKDVARIHNGGPNGWKNTSTLGYWAKVSNSKDKTKKIFAMYGEALKGGNS